MPSMAAATELESFVPKDSQQMSPASSARISMPRRPLTIIQSSSNLPKTLSSLVRRISLQMRIAIKEPKELDAPTSGSSTCQCYTIRPRAVLFKFDM
eukprot:4110509-Amphidinium_carterae.1